MSELLVTHLLDLMSKTPPDSFILAGGLGLRLKRRHLASIGAMTLARSAGYEVPEARATTDIDVFLKMEVFVRPEQGRLLRSALDELQYRERTPKWQFEKQLVDGQPDLPIVLDLLARQPLPSESVRVRSLRVGSGSGTDLHGRETEEAFAVEYDAQRIEIWDEGSRLGSVLTAHPYAWLTMKTRAAHDWLRYQRRPWSLRGTQEPPSAKHAFDAMLILAMLTESEMETCARLANEFSDHPIARAVCTEADELYGTPTSPGWVQAKGQGMFDDHGLLAETMWKALGS